MSGYREVWARELERRDEPDPPAPQRPPVRWVDNGRGPAPEWAAIELFEGAEYPTPTGQPWGPQEGPQTTLAESDADIAVFGGSVGGGKSISLLFEGGRWAHLSTYRAIAFRRISTELHGGGGLWDESQTWYPLLGARARSTPSLEWIWPSGARLEMRHLQYDSDVESHKSKQYAVVLFDELTSFTRKQFWYMVSRLRSTCGVRPYIRAGTNPDADSWVLDELVGWWIGEDGYAIPERSGVVRWFVRVDEELHWFDTRAEAIAAIPGSSPMSFTFVVARTTDNKILMEANPDYVGNLSNLPNLERMRLLGDAARGGNWRVRASAGSVLPKHLFRIADEPPSRVVQTVRCWDKGSTAPCAENPDPDYTRGVRVSRCEGGEWWIDDLVTVRDRPGVVQRAMRETAEGRLDAQGRVVRPGDGVAVTIGLWQEVGASGKVDNETSIDALAGFPVRVVRIGTDKLAYANVWAPWLEGGRVYLKRAPWNAALMSECDGFPDAAHDDIVDALSLAAQICPAKTGGILGKMKAAADAAKFGKAGR